MFTYRYFSSPVGPLLLAGNQTVLNVIRFPTGGNMAPPDPEWTHLEDCLTDVAEQLQNYFSGSLRRFSIALDPQGTDFQRLVWQELLQIPFGETCSYGELAQRLGNPAAVRAVGGANARNPIPIIIPCHRVIGSDGSLTGFGGGLQVKQKMLDFERETCGKPGTQLPLF